MAKGELTREVVSDPNASTGGNAPAQRLAVQGIMTPRGAPAQTDTSVQGAIAAFGAISDKMAKKQQNADFIEGKMAAMSGKTQAEVAAEGNSTSMAGFVSVEVSNAVQEWKSAEMAAIGTDFYGMSSEEYSQRMSKKAAELVAQMGGDDYAQEVLTKSLEPTMQQLAAAQTAQHSAYTQQETVNAYTTSLLQTAGFAAQDYDGAYTNPEGPTGGATGINSDYRAVAQSFTDLIIGAESGGNPNAKNPKSSALGLGQFIGSTWIAMLRKYRPDIAKGRGTQELLDLRTNPALSREMTTAYAAENLAALGAKGLPTTAGTAYLAHFAGLGGATRVLRGNPNSPVSTTMTPSQIKANKSVMYRNGRLITNGELRAWADRKMGKASGSGHIVKSNILANPGLPPAVHRQAVVSAVITGLQAGDGSLFQTAGGIEGLMALNLSPAQINSLRAANENFAKKRQDEYNMDYERRKSDLMDDAASGDFTEDEMFEKLQEMNDTWGRSDAEKLRVHQNMQKMLDGVDLGAWNDPDAQLDLMGVKQDVLDQKVTVEEAVEEIKELGKLYGADEGVTEKKVAQIIAAYEKVQASERAELEKATVAGRKAAKTRSNAERMLSQNNLGTGTKAEQAAGIQLIEEKLLKDMEDNNIPMEDVPAVASAAMAGVLVKNDLIDPKRASSMRAAMMNPVNKDGTPTNEAIVAMSFYMDLKAKGASPEYLARMFRENEKTLEVLMTTEEHMIGDASVDVALTKAHEQVNNPVTQARIKQNMSRLDNGELQTAVKEQIISQSGLADTAWNSVMNLFNPNWHSERLDQDGVDRIMRDAGLDIIIEEETRSAIALYPNASSENIAKIISGQMAERGSIIGGNFVMAPKGKTMNDVLGLNDKGPTAANDAVVAYVQGHGSQLFSPDVWADLKPDAWSLGGTIKGVLTGDSIGRARREAGDIRPEFTVKMVGDLLEITPSSKYAFDDDILFDDFSSRPDTMPVYVDPKKIGEWANKWQLREDGDGLLNTFTDWMRGSDNQGGGAFATKFRNEN